MRLQHSSSSLGTHPSFNVVESKQVSKNELDLAYQSNLSSAQARVRTAQRKRDDEDDSQLLNSISSSLNGRTRENSNSVV